MNSSTEHSHQGGRASQPSTPVGREQSLCLVGTFLIGCCSPCLAHRQYLTLWFALGAQSDAATRRFNEEARGRQELERKGREVQAKLDKRRKLEAAKGDAGDAAQAKMVCFGRRACPPSLGWMCRPECDAA